MAWLHTWAGLLVGWVLFAVFLTGTASYFRGEISQWMRPELHAATLAPTDAATLAVRELQRVAPRSPSWIIGLPTDRDPAIHIFWRNVSGTPRFGNATLDPTTGAPASARDTRGGEFFYRFHFELSMPPIWGRWLVGFCAMMMLVAIISGVITHRRIFADFFTFRPGKAAGRSWLDAHNALAVLALPYHLMITYTGLITLMLMYMPWGAQLAYQGNQQAFVAEALGSLPPVRPAGRPAPLADVAPLVTEAALQWPQGSINRINIANPGDASATIQVLRGEAGRISSNPQSVLFDGVTGERRAVTGNDQPAAATRGVTYGLHLGRFAGPLLRALFFLSGLAGTAMVATGLVLWAAKHRQKRALAGAGRDFGGRLVEVLNITAIAGLPIAMLGFFWANRLLPLDMAGRADAEVQCFFAIWLLCGLHALLRPARRAWIEQFSAAAALGLALPVLNLLTTQRHLGVTLRQGDWPLAGFDLVVAGLGAALCCIVWKLARRGEALEKPGQLPAGAEGAR